MTQNVERVKTMTAPGAEARARTADVIASDLHNGTVTVKWDDTGATETVPACTLQDFTGGWEAYWAAEE